ncbi:MAG: hypothetical protein H0U02_01840 [Rubrobacter sp.]|nr:hypothetical protein [Rubrobacter sp.]
MPVRAEAPPPKRAQGPALARASVREAESPWELARDREQALMPARALAQGPE